MKKAMKIISVCFIIMAVLTIIFSAISLGGGSFVGTTGLTNEAVTEEDQTIQTLAVVYGGAMVVLGIIMLIVGIYDLFVGIMGVRAAKGDVKAAGKAKVMGIISLVLVVLNNGFSLYSSLTWQTVCSAVLGIGIQLAFVVIASKLQHEEAAL